jgi:hypothetical protein
MRMMKKTKNLNKKLFITAVVMASVIAITIIYLAINEVNCPTWVGYTMGGIGILADLSILLIFVRMLNGTDEWY